MGEIAEQPDFVPVSSKRMLEIRNHATGNSA
jgi:hypothetical protein